MQNQAYCSYFLFINSSSGGGVGHKLIQQQKAQKISFDISIEEKGNQKDKKNIDIYFYNLKTNRQKGFASLKRLSQKDANIKVIICGGDGTVVWVINQLSKYNIDTQKIALGIIPLGTGNDFSQYLGWGKLKTTLTQKSFASLKKLIRKWQRARIQYFDIWDIKAQVFQYGKFQKVQNFKNKQIEGKTFERSFCNYFSFGIDGKIGYSFDLHRTQSRLGNLAMYGAMGLLKAMTKTKTMSQLIQGMQIKHQLCTEFIENQEQFEVPIQNIKINKQQIHSSNKEKSVKKESEIKFNKQVKEHLQITTSKVLFKTKQQKSDLKKTNVEQITTEVSLKKDYYNIVALNINSFMGGVFDIWRNAKDQLRNQQSKKFNQMDSGDGKLQFVSFSSSLGMAAQRSFGGFASKMAQGGGPFHFKFKQYEQKQKHRTYLQIDGEFIRFTHPKSILIRKSIYGKNGKVKVLRNIQTQ